MTNAKPTRHRRLVRRQVQPQGRPAPAHRPRALHRRHLTAPGDAAPGVRAQRGRARAGSERSTRAPAKAMPGVVAVVTGEDIKDKIAVAAAAGGAARPAGQVSDALAARGRQGQVPRRRRSPPSSRATSTSPRTPPRRSWSTMTSCPTSAIRRRRWSPARPIVHEGWDNNLIFEMTFTGGATPEDQAKNDAKVQESLRQGRRRRQAALQLSPLRRDADGDPRRALHLGRRRRSDRLPHDAAAAHRPPGAVRHPRHPGREGARHRAARPGRRLRRQGAVLPRADPRRLPGAASSAGRSAGSNRARST